MDNKDISSLNIKLDVSLNKPENCQKLSFLNIPLVNFYIIIQLFYNNQKIRCWYIQI